MDLNLFKEGVFLTASIDYAPVGRAWEALSDDVATCCWGGHFSDGNHFSITFEGRR
jgi:hypothetical protein